MLRIQTKRTFEHTLPVFEGQITVTYRLLTDEQMQELEFRQPAEMVRAAVVSVDGLELVGEDGVTVPAEHLVSALADDPELAARLYDGFVEAWQKKALPKTWQTRLAALQASKPAPIQPPTPEPTASATS